MLSLTKSRLSADKAGKAGKTLLQSLFFFLLVTQICFAQLEFFNNEQRQNISSEQLIDVFNVNIDSLMLDSIITTYMNSENIPGAATLILKDNEMIWNKNYGFRNLQFQLPVEDSTLFLMASISKTIMATAVMQFWENGLVDLEGDINDYLPIGLSVINPFFPNDIITVKMVMTHTSSLRDNFNILDPLTVCGDSPIRLDTFLVNYFTPGGTYYSMNNFYNYHPGQAFNYCNVASCLLALIVEKLSGQSFDEYCRDSIFTPLSMNTTSWFLSGIDTNKIATPYINNPPIPLCHQGFPDYVDGQLRTNKLELSNFLSAYMNGGIFNNRILNSATISMMLTDQCGFVHMWGGEQGLIWFSFPALFDTVWGHAGAWYGAYTYMFFNPQENWGLNFFINWASPPNYSAGFHPTAIQIARYAHLYGNIYALKPSVDKSYARKNIDPVLLRTRFSNIYNHQFTPYLIFADFDSTQIDSLTLFDDGQHGDSLSNDGIYGNHIPPQQTEDIYFLGVSTIDNQTNKYFITPDICSFTTEGPVTLDSISFNKGVGDWYFLKPYVTNHGNSATIKNVKIKFLCDDPWILSFTTSIVNLPDIQPGATVGSIQWGTVKYIDSLFPGYFNIKVEIMSDNRPYWTDSMRVPPIVIISINPSELDFGEVTIDSSETKTFTITNYGDEDLVISDITSSQPVFIVNITSAIVSPDSNQKVEVTFTPTGAISFNGKIEITHNAAGSPDSVIVIGEGIITGVEDETTLPTVYALEQNYPNPFNPSSTIRYQLPKDGLITLKIYDILGREVATLVNEEKPAGTYEVKFKVAQESFPAFASGVYIYKIQAGDFINSKKMLLLK